MRIYVIYKWLSWDSNQQQNLGQAKPKIAKQSHQWEVVGHPFSHSEWEDSVCFEKGARMDSFAVVLTTLSCLSMYEVICVKKRISWLISSDHGNHRCLCVTELFFFIRKLKINHKTPLVIYVYSWDWHRPRTLMNPKHIAFRMDILASVFWHYNHLKKTAESTSLSVSSFVVEELIFKNLTLARCSDSGSVMADNLPRSRTMGFLDPGWSSIGNIWWFLRFLVLKNPIRSGTSCICSWNM